MSEAAGIAPGLRKVAELSAIPQNRPLLVEQGDDKIILVRDGDAVRAYGASCPHAGAPLNEGAVCNGRIICPWHKAEFAVSDGALLEPPALERLTRYEVSTDGDDVLLGEQITPAVPQAETASDEIALIVGAGAAGAACAAFLREFGYTGRIVLAAPEPGAPYDRTSLSKFVMAGEMQPDEVPPLLPDDFFTLHRIERRHETVETLDVTARRATFAGGTELNFHTALVAPGATAKRPDLPGANLGGVHTLRSRADVAAILADLHPGAHAVIIGSSFIGLEAACGLRARKLEVSVVAPETIPFARQFGDEIGGIIRDLHESNGVRFHLGKQAKALQGNGKISAVELQDGTVLPADVVLLAVGVNPATDFMRNAPREKDGGLRVDAGMRLAEGIYAAGDIACFPLPHEGGAARIEHWRVAQQQARVAARNMAGGNAIYDGVPFFWTYHYGKNFEYIGNAREWENIVIDGSPQRQDFVALLCTNGLVQAVVACGREHATALLVNAMRERLSVVDALKLCTES